MLIEDANLTCEDLILLGKYATEHAENETRNFISHFPLIGAPATNADKYAKLISELNKTVLILNKIDKIVVDKMMEKSEK